MDALNIILILTMLWGDYTILLKIIIICWFLYKIIKHGLTLHYIEIYKKKFFKENILYMDAELKEKI